MRICLSTREGEGKTKVSIYATEEEKNKFLLFTQLENNLRIISLHSLEKKIFCKFISILLQKTTDILHSQ